MDFKFDTTKNYTIILPEFHTLNEDMAEKLRTELTNLQQKGVVNFIIDLNNIKNSEASGRSLLLELHAQVYNNEGSLVFTELQDNVLQLMKKDQLHLSLNIAPTSIEAKDIINMEVLERDLLNEL